MALPRSFVCSSDHSVISVTTTERPPSHAGAYDSAAAPAISLPFGGGLDIPLDVKADHYTTQINAKGLLYPTVGHFLIKQVVQEINRENHVKRTFVTLSPVPDFRRWLDRERKADSSVALSDADRAALMAPGSPSSVYQRVSIVDTQPILSLAFDMVASATDEM